MKLPKALCLLTLLSAFVACGPKTDAEKTTATVSQQTIKDHIYYIASDELRGRNTGSPEIQKAADYLAEKLASYGAQPVPGAEGYFQPVPLKQKSPATGGSLAFGSRNFELTSDFLVVDGQSGAFEGEVVYLNYALEEDYNIADVKGKFVFAKIGDGERTDRRSLLRLSRQKTALAKEKGALGLVEFYNAPTPFAQLAAIFGSTNISLNPNGNTDNVIPHLWLKDNDNSQLRFVRNNNIKSAQLNIEGMVNGLTKDKNVVAMIEGTDPELKKEFVMFSAHYDHIGVGQPNAQGDSIYNGTRDNAIGAVTVLTAAENIGKYPMKRSALFVLYTAEEKGLLGSRWMANNPLIPNEDIVFCWNSDNGGYNDTSIATIVGLTRTTAEPMIREAVATFGLEAIEDPTGAEQGLFDRSDNVNFARKGIPAPTFSLGFRAFDEEIVRYYHQQADNPDNVDYDYLYKFFQGYVLASRMIGNAPERPFWVEGDKYYETGKKLYGMD